MNTPNVFAQLAASVAGRAKKFYRLARETLPAEDRRSMAAAELMVSVAWRLLKKLESKNSMFSARPPGTHQTDTKSF